MLTGHGSMPFVARSWLLLREWRATRLPTARFVALSLFIAWAASIGKPIEASALIGRVFVAFMLIVLYRLWDDLIDRKRDRSKRPERVLAQTDEIGAFMAACGGLGLAVALALWTWHGTAALVGLTVASAMLALWYRLHRSRGIAHAHVLLLKYPLFALLLASLNGEWSSLAAALVAVYCGLCSFELIDQGVATTATRIALAGHGCVLTLAAWGGRIDMPSVAFALAAATLCAAAMTERSSALPGRKYWPLLAAVVVLVRLSLGDLA